MTHTLSFDNVLGVVGAAKDYYHLNDHWLNVICILSCYPCSYFATYIKITSGWVIWNFCNNNCSYSTNCWWI